MSSTKIFLGIIGFLGCIAVFYFTYSSYNKNQLELSKLKSENDFLKKEKELLENSKSEIISQNRNTGNKIKELERENSKTKQEIGSLREKLAGSISHKECENKNNAAIISAEKTCDIQVKAALAQQTVEMNQEFDNQKKNLISQKNCDQKIKTRTQEIQADIKKDFEIKLKDIQLQLEKQNNTGNDVVSIVKILKTSLEGLVGNNENKQKPKEKENNLPTSLINSNSSCKFSSVRSSPHLFVDVTTTKFKKKTCLKNAERKMTKYGFEDIDPQTDGIWGIKNGYKGHILCANEGKIAIFSVVGENGSIAENYAKQLKKDF